MAGDTDLDPEVFAPRTFAALCECGRQDLAVAYRESISVQPIRRLIMAHGRSDLLPLLESLLNVRQSEPCEGSPMSSTEALSILQNALSRQQVAPAVDPSVHLQLPNKRDAA